MRRIGGLIVLLLTLNLGGATEWIRAGRNTNAPVWGIPGGLIWAVPPGKLRPQGEPRGLIRVGYPVLTNGGYDLINFIAVEPIVQGRRGFSELELSQTDQKPGKLFWSGAETATSPAEQLSPGTLRQLGSGIEELTVAIGIERFENGAAVQLQISQRTDRPDELRLVVRARPDSAPLDYCILTATMGNWIRARQLWLRDRVVNSLRQYPEHRGAHFAAHSFFPLAQLHRDPDGSVLVALTSDESDPALVHPFRHSDFWYYGGQPVTQYWRKPAATVRPDLRAVVNARYTYWQSQHPIPGGVAYENFELNERYHPGQEFIFGVTRRTPAQLGMSATP
ncbi:MAG TPA: hypothetical protein PKN95_14965 [Verrucomicrobiota bacterium]|nr:hypothetical protein [Verrucomicrobiota bacterium]HNT16207.1 hypothetical protein [Verrucomicrobiota bacterium]